MSDIDDDNVKAAAEPDIILGKDWDEQARADAPESHRPKAKRKWIALNSSPIARKIITFNLMAMAVLVVGVMFLGQSRTGLVNQHQRALETQAMLIAKVFEAQLPSSGTIDFATGDGFSATETLADLNLPIGVEVFVFDTRATIVATSVGLDRDATSSDGDAAAYGTVITDFLNSVWGGIAGLFSLGDNTDEILNAQAHAQKIAPDGLNGLTSTEVVSDAEGNLLFSVATPVRRFEAVLGALVVTTVSGEIDQIVRREREQVLQMFVIAILVSIGLSLVLAGTIASPLRDLASAAELGRARNARSLSPERVRIPDMTARPDEIGRLSGAMRGMIAALYDRIDSNEQFAADVAHEIKNPLSSLRSAVETLRIAKNDVQRLKLMDVVEHDVRRLDRLVSDISNASRLDAELVKDQMKTFDLTDLLDNIVSFTRPDAEKIGAEFISDLPDEPVMVQGLEERLAQVFVNLLTNALSFCEDGDAVRIWARKRENRILVVVEDTGPGIPDQALSKIFSRFYSERPADDFGNHSGLGLAISRQIVEAHGGVIWAENIRPTDADITSEPLGARFVVGLPV